MVDKAALAKIEEVYCIMKSVYDVIIRPVITEQSMEDLDIKKYRFSKWRRTPPRSK